MPRQTPQEESAPGARKAGRPRDPEIHRRVLDAAAELLSQVGYLELTMDKVATQAGVTRKTLYHRWPSKAALVGELMVHDSIIDEVPDLGSTRDELLTLFGQILRDARHHDARGILPVLWASMGDADVMERHRREVIGPRRRLAQAALQRGIARGDLPPDTDINLVLDMWSGIVVFRKEIRADQIYQDQVEQLVDMALAGQVPRLPRAASTQLAVLADAQEASPVADSPAAPDGEATPTPR